jgi:hypothetical protein
MGGAHFELAPRYGEVLNIAAMAFVFGAVMPIFLPIFAAAAAVAYYLQLGELLTVSRRPAQQVRAE